MATVSFVMSDCPSASPHGISRLPPYEVSLNLRFEDFDVEYIYGFVGWGVCKQSRWRNSVTVPSQDGGYMLLWQRYDNNKMADMCYYGNVMTTTRWRKQVQSMTVVLLLDVYTELVIDVFYIFNGTVIDWTCYILFTCRHCGRLSGLY